MIDYLQQLGSTATEIDSTPDFLFSSSQSQLIQPDSTPLPPFQQGVFEVGAEGAVEIDFLFDGGEREGEIGIFNLANMPTNLQEFKNDALARALNNTSLGYTIISDVNEGARITGTTPNDDNHNQGIYNGSKSFSLEPNTQFGLILSPNGSIKDAITNPGSTELVFSTPEANFNQSTQLAQVPGIDFTGLTFNNSDTFAFEDMTGVDSDKDFNDAILQIKGTTGSATQLDEVINPERDWRGFESGKQILELVGRQKEDEPPIVINPPVITEPPVEEAPMSIGLLPGEGSENGEVGEEGGGESTGEEELVPPVVEDKAGDTLAEAAPTIPSSTGKLYQDSVSIDDKDYYFFTLGASNEIKISADGMGKDVDLELLDNEGNVIASSKNEGGEKEIIEREVEHGSYKLLVTSSNPEPTAYNLDLITKPLLEGITTSGSEELVYLQTQESLPLIGADDFGKRSDNFKDNPLYPDIDGAGYSAVVIDSGINVNHPAFGKDENGDDISDRIKYQYDFTDGDNDVEENNVKQTAKGHGTNVSSIIASEDEEYPGVAPRSNIIALKIFPDQPNLFGIPIPFLGKATHSFYVEQALQWVIANADNPEYNIAAVNLSLNLSEQSDKNGNYKKHIKGFFNDEIKKLIELGIIVVVSAGNSYKKYQEQGLGYPASEPDVIAVGAVYDSDVGEYSDLRGAKDLKTKADKIAAFSQRSGDLPMVFAPGIYITGASEDKFPFSPYSKEQGTSQAAPHVTGMAILAQQLAEQELGRRLTPEEFRELLISTSDTITDEETDDDNVKNTGLTYSRVNMTKLADTISNKDLVEVEIIETSSELNTSEEIYSKITIDGNVRKTTPIENQSSIFPSDWLSIKGAENEEVPIKIELFINNESQEQIDINPKIGVQELNLLYNTKTGNIYDRDNDKNHFKGEELRRTGDDKQGATIKFMINNLNTDTHTPSKKPISINISKVKGSLDPLIPFIYGSDFYSTISINNIEKKFTQVYKNQNELNPNWNITELVENTVEIIPISIEIFDYDKDEWFSDDEEEELNINPNPNLNNLNLTYNQITGEIKDEITGQIYGKQGEVIKIKGSEGKTGEIEFVIN